MKGKKKANFEIIDLEEIENCPPSRYGHSSSLIEKIVYVFGGSDGTQFFSDLLKFDTEEVKWSEEVLKDDTIDGVHFHSSAFMDNRIFFFGGKSNGYKNDLIIFDVFNDTFKKLEEGQMQGEVPTKRYGHSAAIIPGKAEMYVFGGYCCKGFDHNQLYKYEIEKNFWTRINFKKNPIPRRYFHSGILVNFQDYYIINGLNKRNQSLGDIWVINLVDLTLKELKTKKSFFKFSHKNSKSYGQQSFVLNNKIWIYGGRNKERSFERFCRLEKKNKWKAVDFPFSDKKLLSYSSVNVSDDPPQKKISAEEKAEAERKKREEEEAEAEADLSSTDFFKILPDELLLEIFSFLDQRAMAKVGCISKLGVLYSDFYWKPLFEKTHRRIEVLPKWKVKTSEKTAYRKCVKKAKTFRAKYAAAREFLSKCRSRGGTENIKCVVVGDGAVGKTCMLISYANNSFPDDYVPTNSFALKYSSATVLYDNCHVSLGLWDTAGEEDYDRLRPLSYPETNVFLMCFSLVDPTSLENIPRKWDIEIEEHAHGVPKILVGTKLDLREDPQIMRELDERGEKPVTRQQGERVAREIKADGYFENSAKTQKGLKETFQAAIKTVLDPEDGIYKKDETACVIQ